MRIVLTLLGVLAVCLAGCDRDSSSSGSDGKSAAPPQAADTPKPPAVPKPVVEPVYTLELVPDASNPPHMIVKWSAKVNTGGWSLKTESVLVEESMQKRIARVYAILESPGPEEIVTQSIETLSGSHDAGAVQVDGAELSIKRVTRGDKSGYLPMYVIVQRVGARL